MFMFKTLLQAEFLHLLSNTIQSLYLQEIKVTTRPFIHNLSITIKWSCCQLLARFHWTF